MKEKPASPSASTRREKRNLSPAPERVSASYLQEQLKGPIDEGPSLPAEAILAERQGCGLREDAPAPLFVP